MKKQLLTVITAVYAGLCFSQNVTIAPNSYPAIQQVNLTGSTSNSIIPHGAVNLSQNRAVSIWLDDFSNPSTWTADNDGQIGANFGWNINSTSESWYTSYDFSTGIASSSGGNFAEVQNGNYNTGNQAIGVVYTLTTATSIDINTLSGGNNLVSLQFEQYGGLFNDSQIFQVSTDGVTWTNVGNNNSRTTFIGNNPTALYANPELVTIDISSAIAGNPSTVWIRFEYTSRFPSDPGTNAWTTFGWYIDDVQIVETPANDITLNKIDWGYDYGGTLITYPRIPLSQIETVSFSGDIINIGTADQTGITLSANANAGSFSGTSAAASILSGDTATLTVTTNYLPSSALGTYDINLEALMPSTDGNPANNTIVDSVEITEYLYSRTNGVMTGGNKFFGTGGYIVGNLFHINKNATIPQSIRIKIHSSTQGTPDVWGHIYEYNGSWNLIADTYFHTVTTAEITNSAEIDLPFDSQIQLDSGNTYLVAFEVFDENVYLGISEANSHWSTTLISNDGLSTIYGFGQGTPMIDLVLSEYDPANSSNFCDGTDHGWNVISGATNPTCANTCDGSIVVQPNPFGVLTEDYDGFFAVYYNTQTMMNDTIYSITGNFSNLCADTYEILAYAECFNGINYISGGGSSNLTLSTANAVALDSAGAFSSNTSNCNATDGYINITVYNQGGNIDISWNGPVSGSFTNITPTLVNLPNLSNGTYQIIASVTGNPACSSDTTYINVMTNTISQEVCVVTVDDLTSSYNILVWEKPTSMQAIDSFYVYREITTNNYQKIAAIDGNDLSEYEDFAANPNATNYKYKIKVLDVCGSVGDFGLYHNSIHLQYLGFGNFQWTPYEIESTSNQVGSYNFYRDDNGTGNFVLLQIIPGGNTTFTDVNYASFPNAIYRVDVNWTNGNNCTSTKANINTSRSNKKQQVVGNSSNVLELVSSSTKLSPVPAKNIVELSTPSYLESSKYQILNSAGAIVYSSIISSDNTIIDISQLSIGLYFVVIQTDYGVVSKKLIKE